MEKFIVAKVVNNPSSCVLSWSMQRQICLKENSFIKTHFLYCHDQELQQTPLQLFDMIVFFFVFLFVKLDPQKHFRKKRGGRKPCEQINKKVKFSPVLELKLMCSLAIRLWQQNDTVAQNKAAVDLTDTSSSSSSSCESP